MKTPKRNIFDTNRSEKDEIQQGIAKCQNSKKELDLKLAKLLNKMREVKKGSKSHKEVIDEKLQEFEL